MLIATFVCCAPGGHIDGRYIENRSHKTGSHFLNTQKQIGPVFLETEAVQIVAFDFSKQGATGGDP